MGSEILKLDLYAILGVDFSASSQTILKAYRKKALKCHPDKNPNNPNAANQFLELSKALEVLTDEVARASYDKLVKSRKAAELRHQQLDSKRKKFKEELEKKEAVFRKENESYDESAADTLENRISQLRKEGSLLLQQEQELLQSELKTNKPLKLNHQPTLSTRLKLKWNSSKSDMQNGGYSIDVLRELFSKYGDIVALVVSKNKNGSGVIEFESVECAKFAKENEKGLASNPIKIVFLNNSSQKEETSSQTNTLNFPTSSKEYEQYVLNNLSKAAASANHTTSKSNFQIFPKTVNSACSFNRDTETLQMRSARQAAERKRLIDELNESNE